MHGVLPVGAVHLSAARDLLLALAGFGAGLVNGVAGGGTLVSFPVLLALGFPALSANVTSTVGIWPGYLSALVGFRDQLGRQGPGVRLLAPVAAARRGRRGVLAAHHLAGLLRPARPVARPASPPGSSRSSRCSCGPCGAVPPDYPTRRVLLVAGTFVTCVYGGYFGAGMGVMLLAVLGLALPDTLARTSGLRTVVSALVNGVAAVIFVVHFSLLWVAVALLAAGSLAGGWVGARTALRLPGGALRLVVVAIGVVTAARLLTG